jgi:hypothetical protein
VFRGEIMLKLELDLKPETERRFKHILDGYSDKEIFVSNLVSHQINELQYSIMNIEHNLKELEKKYNITSKAFYSDFNKGKYGDDEDYMLWSGLYETLQYNKKKLKELL